MSPLKSRKNKNGEKIFRCKWFTLSELKKVQPAGLAILWRTANVLARVATQRTGCVDQAGGKIGLVLIGHIHLGAVACR